MCIKEMTTFYSNSIAKMMQNTLICNLSTKPWMESICWQQRSNTL